MFIAATAAAAAIAAASTAGGGGGGGGAASTAAAAGVDVGGIGGQKYFATSHFNFFRTAYWRKFQANKL